jgi:hypothetical protein
MNFVKVHPQNGTPQNHKNKKNFKMSYAGSSGRAPV